MSKINSPIALVITDQETNARIKKLDLGLLELRVDLFKKQDIPYIISQIKHRKQLKIPLLLTVRNQKQEGAVKAFSDGKKWEIITAALPLVHMVDIELSSPLLKKTIDLARKLGKKVIVSSHYFKATPKNLEAVLKRSWKAGAGMVKIAALARSFDDVVKMFAFTQKHRTRPLITMCLGPIGSVSRLILPAAGSRYTYTFLNKPKAPGQVDVMTLQSHLQAYFRL